MIVVGQSDKGTGTGTIQLGLDWNEMTDEDEDEPITMDVRRGCVNFDLFVVCLCVFTPSGHAAAAVCLSFDVDCFRGSTSVAIGDWRR